MEAKKRTYHHCSDGHPHNVELLKQLTLLKEVCPDPHVIRFYALLCLLGNDGITVLYSRKHVNELKQQLRRFIYALTKLVRPSDEPLQKSA
ncbi:MAG TPA: hypothetical protein VIU41_08600 [Geobacteraceae bacterium]